MGMNQLFVDYAKDLEKYFESKLPDIPDHVAMEISEYISNKTCNLVNSVLYERDREWNAILRKGGEPRRRTYKGLEAKGETE